MFVPGTAAYDYFDKIDAAKNIAALSKVRIKICEDNTLSWVEFMVLLDEAKKKLEELEEEK